MCLTTDHSPRNSRTSFTSGEGGQLREEGGDSEGEREGEEQVDALYSFLFTLEMSPSHFIYPSIAMHMLMSLHQ